MLETYFRWSPLFPEQMVPGSLWKLKDETALYYLEDYKQVELYFEWKSYSQFSTANGWYPAFLPEEPSLLMNTEKIYLLTKIEEKNGQYCVQFLDDTQTINIKIVKYCWDSVFSLVKKTNSPKKGKKMLFGRIPIEKLIIKIKK